jgi:hypothetical protein
MYNICVMYIVKQMKYPQEETTYKWTTQTINNPKKQETAVTVYDKYVSQILFLSFETGGHPFHQRPNF